MKQESTNRWRWGVSAVVMLLALVTAACDSGTGVTTQPTPGAFQRGTWARPAYPNVSAPTVSAVGFADGDQRVGYACSAELNSGGSATPVPGGTATTGTPVATPTAAETPAPGSQTTPTTVPGFTVISDFWRTSDGGMSWQAATLPTTESGLLCPISTIYAPDVANPSDVFFLAAFGDLNLQDPSSIVPGQDRYELWRSQDGAHTWKQLTLPGISNPINPVLLWPYHLAITVQQQNLLLGTNFSGANYLFSSANGGKTWQQIAGVPINGTPTSPSTLPFAGFAQGPGNSLLALVAGPANDTAATYQIYQTKDNAKTWKQFATPTINPPTNVPVQTQIFTAPGGEAIFVLARTATQPTPTTQTTPTPGATPTATPPVAQMTMLRSLDGGATWTPLGWPTEAGTTGTPVGSVNIATLGTEFAVDARGDAFIAPTNNDLTPQQDPQSQLSAGFFEAAATQSQWSQVAQPPVAQNTAFTLAVSLVPASALPTGTPTTSATGTALPATATPAPTATAAPTGTPAAGATPTPLPGADGLPALWSNFGPSAQFTTAPDTAGFFLNVLP